MSEDALYQHRLSGRHPDPSVNRSPLPQTGQARTRSISFKTQRKAAASLRLGGSDEFRFQPQSRFRQAATAVPESRWPSLGSVALPRLYRAVQQECQIPLDERRWLVPSTSGSRTTSSRRTRPTSATALVRWRSASTPQTVHAWRRYATTSCALTTSPPLPRRPHRGPCG